MRLRPVFGLFAALALSTSALADDDEVRQPTSRELIENAPANAWRSLDPENTLYLDLPAGTVIIELRADFAPNHVQRIKELTREKFYDGVVFHRVIEGFMAQGGDPTGTGTGSSDKPNLEAEFTRDAAEVEGLTVIGRDRIAPRIGYVDGMPVAAQPEALRTFIKGSRVDLWPVHCPGVMSMARATDPNSANSQFFLMIGDSRLNLDKRYTGWGWIVDGFEASRRIARGEPPSRPTPIIRARIEADIPESERENIQVLKTSDPVFIDYLKTRGQLSDDGLVKDICEIRVPIKKDGKIEL
ncbi:peptidylprolyl isomerase [Hyphococcus formosus]|uniref:peptidylprolyl isomerase n=1 Tax=Hyphococcus formosus TaxID=3143534 RepID=UPI00398B671F